MPALRACFSKFALLLLCVLLSACDRHNDISEPMELVGPDAPDCVWASNFPEGQPYISSVTIDRAFQDEQLSIPFQFSPTLFQYDVYAGYIVDKARISLVYYSEESPDNAEGEIPSLESLIIEISDEQINADDTAPTAQTDKVLDIDDNTFVLEVKAKVVEVLVTQSAACGYPSQQAIDSARDREAPSPIPTRTVDDYVRYTFNITRQDENTLADSEQIINSAVVSSLSANDNFGGQVLLGSIVIDRISGLSRDVMIVGVPLEDSNARGVIRSSDLATVAQDDSAIDSGAVYVYERNSIGQWVLSHFIKSANSDAGDRFGSVIALYDNLLVVSALGEDGSASGINSSQINNLAPDSGAVYVFEYLIDNWQQTTYLKKPNNSVGIDGFDDAFGTAVSLDNGYLLISAPKEDSSTGNGGDINLPNSGAAYLYSVLEPGDATARSFSFIDTFKAENANSNDYFGMSLDMSPDATRFAVGSTGEGSQFRGVIYLDQLEIGDEELESLNDNGAVDSGAVYIFHKEGSTWADEAYIKSSNSDVGDKFGSSVRFLDDATLLVGAPLEDGHGKNFNRNLESNSLPNSGAVYLYSRLEEQGWSPNQYIKAPEPQVDANFGGVLDSFEGNFVAAAPGHIDAVNEASGAVYGYQFDNSRAVNERLTNFFTLSGHDSDLTTRNERYGRSVALFGNIIAVGAPGMSDQTDGILLERAGGVFVYQ